MGVFVLIHVVKQHWKLDLDLNQSSISTAKKHFNNFVTLKKSSYINSPCDNCIIAVKKKHVNGIDPPTPPLLKKFRFNPILEVNDSFGCPLKIKNWLQVGYRIIRLILNYESITTNIVESLRTP